MSKPLHEMLNDLKDDYEARLAAAEREVERWKSMVGVGTKEDAERISRLEEALRGTVSLIEEIDWTAFSLSDRAKLDAARAALGERDARG